jgi:transposase, IS5 family
MGSYRSRGCDRFKVWISGQIRRVTKAIRREMRRRAAVEPVTPGGLATHRANEHTAPGISKLDRQ